MMKNCRICCAALPCTRIYLPTYLVSPLWSLPVATDSAGRGVMASGARLSIRLVSDPCTLVVWLFVELCGRLKNCRRYPRRMAGKCKQAWNDFIINVQTKYLSDCVDCALDPIRKADRHLRPPCEGPAERQAGASTTITMPQGRHPTDGQWPSDTVLLFGLSN